jgi:hypothetical protein
VHKLVVKILRPRGSVFFGSEACKSFLVDEDAKRVDACDEHIYAEIELEAFDKVGLMQVTLDYTSVVFDL